MSAGAIVLWLIAMVLILLLNAFFVATEFALVASRRSRIQELVESGDSLAVIVQKLQSDIGRSVSGTQLGITLCSLGLGWVADHSINQAVGMMLGMIPGLDGIVIPSGVGVVISFLLLSSMHVVIGEQVPKFISLSIPESVARRLSPFFRLYCFLAWPFIWLMDKLAAGILRLMGLRKPSSGDDAHMAHTAAELQILIDASMKGGELGERETDLLTRVLDLRDLDMAGVLMPIDKVDAVSSELRLAALLDVVSKTKHSRLPVYNGNVDNIVGVLYTRDLFDWWKSTLDDPAKMKRDFKSQKFIRPAFVVERTHKASALLDDMRKRKVQIAVVKDGAKTVGIVTMEDLIEELVGEIYDEHDKLPKSA